jgi:type IV pilus assembly protein PilC
LEAATEEQANSLLGLAGYQVINLKIRSGIPSLTRLFEQFTPIKPTDIILFYRQMALLIESGLNIVTSLELLEKQASNKTLSGIIRAVIADLREGAQLSTAMAKHPEVFSAIQCHSLKVGEQTGGLETILRQMADHMEREVNNGKGVKNAMIYPIIALVVAVVVIAIMVVFVLPAFNKLYEALGAQLPPITRMVLALGDLLRAYGVYIVSALFAALLAGMIYIKTPGGRYQWDLLSFKFPLVGRINHLNEMARLCRAISVLFKAGLPLTEIMPLVIQSSHNKVIEEALVNVRDDMLGGEGLSNPMTKNVIFLPMMVQMVRVGEETGNLDNTLLSVAQSYEAEAEDKTKAFIAMIQPVMTIVIGLVVGFMALSLVSAMYSIYGQSGV